ncbi:unnamed protein product [Nippostrongylus brasiliensis]|uniref:Venom protein n=1 Tax=Nippostrongylus brasiliensis TaxID=27835 RepID=A0A0N4YHH7_NIPBR|nr:unnamed protein product [Nippostrongylus brasiliensis]
MSSALLLALIAITVFCSPIDERFDDELLAKERSIQKRAINENVCLPTLFCRSDADCRGGTCTGAFINTCSCTQCMEGMRCDSDAMCGGLKGACDINTDICNCTAGYLAAGFSSLSDALINFCDVKECTKENAKETCFGLPCQAGNCVCTV